MVLLLKLSILAFTIYNVSTVLYNSESSLYDATAWVCLLYTVRHVNARMALVLQQWGFCFYGHCTFSQRYCAPGAIPKRIMSAFKTRQFRAVLFFHVDGLVS